MLLLLWLGCSFGTVEYVPCTSNSECRDALGFGYLCSDELCAEISQPDRCTTVYPEDLFTDLPAHADDIVLGSVYNHDVEEGDLAETRATELAVIQANVGLGLDGRNFALVQCSYEVNSDLDSLTDAEALVEVGTWLAEEVGIKAVLGPATSGQAEVAYSVFEPADVLIVSPSATSVALTTMDGVSKSDEDPGLFWRTAFPDDVQGEKIADYMVQDGVKTVTVIAETGPYGDGLARVFRSFFDNEEAGRVSTLLSFSDTSQRDEHVTTAGQSDDEYILFISSELSDITAFLEAAARSSNYTGRPIFLTDAAWDHDIFAVSSDVFPIFDNIHGSSASAPEGDVYDFFAASYSATYSRDANESLYLAYAYDAAWLAIYGAAWSSFQEGGLSGTGMARGLRQISEDNDNDDDDIPIVASNWSTVQSYFREGTPINVEGASGQLDYDSETGETTGRVDIWTIDSVEQKFSNE